MISFLTRKLGVATARPRPEPVAPQPSAPAAEPAVGSRAGSPPLNAPTNADALVDRARLAMASHRNADALLHLRAALEMAPNLVTAKLLLSHCERRVKRPT
ncbi:MAG: hypothetical protein RLZZ244_2766 [Verrucomicrobiota bacterium]